jgi:hypothetical protein
MPWLPCHLAFTVTAHLTETETRLLNQQQHQYTPITWTEVVVSLSLCRYNINHALCLDRSFLLAVIKTAPYEALVLPTITTQLHQNTDIITTNLLENLIFLHRPIRILDHLFTLVGRAHSDCDANVFCDAAAVGNNTEALIWLRDPTTNGGRHPWSFWTCVLAARCGYVTMLQRLRDPALDGGPCPWRKGWCQHDAIRFGQLELAAWVDTQPDDD